jgi:hypothetical protein
MDRPRKNILLNILSAVTILAMFGCKGVEPYHNPRRDIHMTPEDPLNEICSNGLPVIFINTPDSIDVSTKHKWVKHATLQIATPDSLTNTWEIKIKGHGNGTWRNYPKKPYTFVFKKPRSILGIEPGQRYVLLANWRDRTLMRNAVALEISRKTCLDWTPDGRFVELVMNGQFLGNYYLTEKVNIEKDSAHVRVGENGYMVNFDTGYDEEKGFITKIKKYAVEVADRLERDLTPEERKHVQEYIDSTEDMIYNHTGDWHERLDIDSFCDWYIVEELTENPELTRPRSTYMHITEDGILHAGPCWDFDYMTFIRRNDRLLFSNTVWYDAFLKDSIFVRHMKARWKALKPSFETEIPAFIDSTRSEIAKSDSLNHQMWPIIGWFDNKDEKLSFNKAVNRLKKNYLKRLNAMDDLIEDL